MLQRVTYLDHHSHVTALLHEATIRVLVVFSWAAPKPATSH